MLSIPTLLTVLLFTLLFLKAFLFNFLLLIELIKIFILVDCIFEKNIAGLKVILLIESEEGRKAPVGIDGERIGVCKFEVG